MLYKFKSKNAGDVIMLEPTGQKMLEIIGKDAGPTGIVLAAQMPAAIDALQAAIAAEESIQQKQQQELEAKGTSLTSDAPTLRQRATPFIDMLKRNYKAGTDVTWGV